MLPERDGRALQRMVGGTPLLLIFLLVVVRFDDSNDRHRTAITKYREPLKREGR